MGTDIIRHPLADIIAAATARAEATIAAAGGHDAYWTAREAEHAARMAARGEVDPADRDGVTTEDDHDDPGVTVVRINGNPAGLVSDREMSITRGGVIEHDDDAPVPGCFYAASWFDHIDPARIWPAVHVDVYPSRRAAVRGVVQCDDEERADHAAALTD